MKNTITKNNQPIKEITQQDIHDLRDYLEQLASWQERLKQIHNFFANQAIPLNKKKNHERVSCTSKSIRCVL